MNVKAAAQTLIVDCNEKVLYRYLAVVVLVLAASGGYALLRGNYLWLAPVVGLPAGLLIFSKPRWALYQFVVCLFVGYSFDFGRMTPVIEISGAIVILAAGMDLLLKTKTPRRLPPLFFNFVFLLTAVTVASVFAFEPLMAWQPLSRIFLMTILFLSLCRLIRPVGVDHIVRLFFWIAVVNSLVVIAEFVLSAGGLRSFGLSPRNFDDMAMLSLPLGLVFFLWAQRGREVFYGVACLIVFCALLATQSRASAMFAIFFSFVAVVVVLRHRSALRPSSEKEPSFRPHRILRRSPLRLVVLFLAGFTLVGAAIWLSPTLLSAVATRFGRVLALDAGGTVGTRFELWRVAWMAFTTNPLVGIGPGQFRTAWEVFSTLHLSHTYHWVRGLSAHNPFFHYLAETGLIGTTALVALVINQFRIGRRQLFTETNAALLPVAQALFVMSLAFFVTMFIEAGWMWGHLSNTFVFFLAVISLRAKRPSQS